jgi:hypothetical protein
MAENQQVQKSSSGSLLGWVAGVFLVILGLANLSNHIGAAIFFLIAACFVLPITLKRIERTLPIAKSRGGKIAAGTILVAICSIVALSIGVSDSKSNGTISNQNSPTPTTAQTEQTIPVTAAKLMADYEANEVAADAQYKGKLVDVTGTIESIGKDILDAPYVALRTNEYSFPVVQCMFERSEQAQLASLSKDTRITLRGRVSSKLGNIIVRDCSIVR